MNKNVKKYKILFYVCFVITFICNFAFSVFSEDLGLGLLSIYNILLYVDLFFVLLFILGCKKFKLKKFNLFVPIIYLIFFTIMLVLCFVLNFVVMIPYIHFNYYYNFILIGHLIFNLYSLLCLTK